MDRKYDYKDSVFDLEQIKNQKPFCESESKNELIQNQEKRFKNYLLYVKLPNMINEIFKMCTNPENRNVTNFEMTYSEMQKVVNAEMESCLNQFESLTGLQCQNIYKKGEKQWVK